MTWLRDIDRWLIEAVFPAGPRYRALAARLVGRPDADDLVQEAYVRLLSTKDWRGIAHPVAFTLQIVRNLALDRLRRASVVRIDQALTVDLLEIADEAPDAYASLAGRGELARVMRLVDLLPPQRRAVVKMRKYEGMAPKTIADSLGLSVSTVEKHLAAGLASITAAMASDLAVPHETSSPKLWSRRKSKP